MKHMTSTTGVRNAIAGTAIIVMTLAIASQAQTLPPPSRTVFKCDVGGKVVYSDAPCLGARRVDVEPTRGANKMSGKELVGADVRREQHREAFAEAIKPITGMNAKQLDVAANRMKLTTEAQEQCRKLDTQIPVAEAADATALGKARDDAQSRLFALRRQFRDLRC